MTSSSCFCSDLSYSFIPAISFAVLFFSFFFRKTPSKIHLLIYVFTKHVNKKGRGTQGEIWWGTLCQVQDSRHHPLNISFTFAAEFIMPPECCRRKQRQCHYKMIAASEAGWEQRKQAICNIYKCLFVFKLPHMLIYTPVGCKAEEMTWLAKPLQRAEEIPAPFLGDLRWSQLEKTFQQLPEGFWKWHWQCSVCMEVREGGRANSLHSSIEQPGCFEGCSVDSLGFGSSVCRSVCVGRPCFSKWLAPLGCAAYPVAWKRHSAGRSARGRR